MGGDLPDYEKKVVVVTVPGDYPAEMKVDIIKLLSETIVTPSIAHCLPVSIEHIVKMNHWQILGEALKTPTFANCVPTSIENDALAYEDATDRFKVKVEAWTAGDLAITLADLWARQLGQVDLYRVLGATMAHANPVIVRLTTGTTWLDPTQIRALTNGDAVTVYGSQTQKLLQRASTYDTIVQLRHNGVEIDPTAIRALTSSDAITVYGSLDKLQQQATTKELFVQISHAGVAKDPTAIRALTSSDVVTAQQTTRANMTVKPEREDLINLGGVVSPNNAGVQIVAPSGQLKVKVFDAGYEAVTAGLHYFYFGTSTTATTRRFCTRQTVGVRAQSFPNPRVSNAADGLYLFSAVNDPNIPYDVNYVQE